jgi:hypothetical protein
MFSGSRWVLFSSVIALAACGSDHPSASTAVPDAGDAGGGEGGRPNKDAGAGGISGDAGAKPKPDAAKKDTTPPTFTGISKIAAVGEGAVRVSWDAASDDVTAPDAMGYRVYRAPKTGAQDFSRKRRCGEPLPDAGAATRADLPCYVSAPSGATSVVVGDVQPASEFFYVAHAVDSSGNEDSNTAEATFTTDDASPPAFGGVESVSAASATSIDVAWGTSFDSTAPDSDVTFEVFVKAGDVPNPDKDKPAYESKPGEHEAIIDGLDPLTTYKVVVRALDPSGNVDDNTSSLGVTTPEGVAPTFDGIRRASADGTTVRLFWLPASDNSTNVDNIVYDVYSSLTQHREDFTKPPRATSAQGAASITLVEKNLGTRYYYVVRARDFAGNRDTNIAEKSAQTGALPDTKPPTFTGATAVKSMTPMSIEVSWNPAADDRSMVPAEFTYQVFVATSTPVPTKTPAVTIRGANTATVVGLLPATDYSVVVLAQDAEGNTSDVTPFVRVTTLAAVAGDTTPPALAGLPSIVPVYPTPSRLTVSWTAATDPPNAGADIRYLVCASTVQTDCTGAKFASHVAVTTAFGTTSATLDYLAPRTKYFVDVRAEDRAGNVEATDHIAPAVTATSWKRNAAPVLFNHCVSCHDYDTPTKTVGVTGGYVQTSTETPSCTTLPKDSPTCILNLVHPGHPEFSLIYRRINPLGLTTAPFSQAGPNLYTGVREPRDTIAKLTTDEDAIVREWIEQGAFASD